MSQSEQPALQRNFFASMGTMQQFRELFEHLPGVHFFVKDNQSRLICANRELMERLGKTSEEEFVGTNDFDYFPTHIAERFIRDDQLVISTGQPLLNRIEFWYTPQKLLDWFITNKLPVYDTRGKVIGLMGYVRSYEGTRQQDFYFSKIARIVEHIRTHHPQRIAVTDLADMAGVSPRQLHRWFHAAFGVSVQDFLSKTRIQSASESLLNSDRPLAQIAIDFGFYDQSAFTRQFTRHVGMTPHQFRLKHRQGGNV